jgi:hypothetical protein
VPEVSGLTSTAQVHVLHYTHGIVRVTQYRIVSRKEILSNFQCPFTQDSSLADPVTLVEDTCTIEENGCEDRPSRIIAYILRGLQKVLGLGEVAAFEHEPRRS